MVGKYIKRYAVKTFVAGLELPVSLPNRFSGENLMLEVKGKVTPELVASQVEALLHDRADLSRRRDRLLATMPKPGAAKRLVDAVLTDF
jgi:hypothetical protein